MDALIVRRARNSTDRYEHLSESAVMRFVDKQCEVDEESAIEAHILTCPECVDRLRRALASGPRQAES